MKRKVVVLGAGMVGSAIARELKRGFRVTSVDRSKDALSVLKEKYGIESADADFGDLKRIKKLVADADLVIGAVPGFLGFQVFKQVIECGKNMVDISFFPENALELDKLAKKKNCTAIFDCGVAPGLDNLLLGYHYGRMKVNSFICMVGGLPVTRTLPFQYKAPFSPIDVIEEYTRPARLVEHGEIVVRPALSEPELVEFPEIGTLEAFNTDGLRSLMFTKRVSVMKEKTLRYPGHRDVIMALHDSGMFGTEEVHVKGVKVKPLEVTAKVLLPQWKLNPEEKEFTVMRIVISGKEKGREKTYTYNLFDRYDERENLSSMARTTGFTCAAAANLVLSGTCRKKGVVPPEVLGEDEKAVSFILNYLKDKGVFLNCS